VLGPSTGGGGGPDTSWCKGGLCTALLSTSSSSGGGALLSISSRRRCSSCLSSVGACGGASCAPLRCVDGPAEYSGAGLGCLATSKGAGGAEAPNEAWSSGSEGPGKAGGHDAPKTESCGMLGALGRTSRDGAVELGPPPGPAPSSSSSGGWLGSNRSSARRRRSFSGNADSSSITGSGGGGAGAPSCAGGGCIGGCISEYR
jgi:hypothetical protein